jgi:cell wall-associated NlpC family hydrolase
MHGMIAALRGHSRLLAALVASLAVAFSLTAGITPARAATAVHRPHTRQYWAWHYALAQAGKPYQWGGTGPYAFDCSGLVMEAYAHAGVRLPRTTWEMLADWRQLVRTYHPTAGTLAFYGGGSHVELFDKPGWTFGAHDSGTLIGAVQYGWGWVPTVYMNIRQQY